MAEFDAVRFRDFEHAGWEHAASVYERHWLAVTAKLLPALLDRTGVGPGVRLLDVACGTGHGVAAARDRGAAAVGVDFSATMLAVARSAVPGARFEEADAEALPFPDGHFDVVLCNFGLLHFARPDAALREMARVLRPGGRLGVSVWAGPERMRLLGIVRGAVATGATEPDAAPPGPDFFQHADPDRFQVALTDAGLTEVGTEVLSFSHRLPDAETLWIMATQGSVRTAALIRSQPPAVQQTIRRLIEDGLEPYRDPAAPGYLIPTDAVLAFGGKGR